MLIIQQLESIQFFVSVLFTSSFRDNACWSIQFFFFFLFVFIGLSCTIRRLVDRRFFFLFLSLRYGLLFCHLLLIFFFSIHFILFGTVRMLLMSLCISIKIKMYVANLRQIEQEPSKYEAMKCIYRMQSKWARETRGKNASLCHYYRYLTIKWLSLVH